MNWWLYANWFIILFVFTIITINFKASRDELKKGVCHMASFAFVLSSIAFLLDIPATPSLNFMWLIIITATFLLMYHVTRMNNFRGIMPLTLVSIFFIINTSPLFRAKEMSELIAPKEIDAPLFRQVQESELRIIPEETAIVLHKNTIKGQLENGSLIKAMFKLDKSPTLQTINGEMYYVTPLTWGSYWKRLLNDYDSIGYVISSATDKDAEAKLITKNPDGSDIKIKVTRNGAFSSDVNRRIRSKFGNVLLSDTSFYLDENMYPYYVTYKHRLAAGFTNYKPDGAYVTDPQTYEVTYYNQKDIPDFIDIHASRDLLIDNIEKWGEYREGFVKSFGSTITLKPSEKPLLYIGLTHIDTPNGTGLFTGMVNLNQSNNNLDAMMFIDSKTLDAYIYYPKIETPSEMEVLRSVLSLTSRLNIDATLIMPTPYRIHDQCIVWLTPIITSGSKGNIKGYALTKTVSEEKTVTVFDTNLPNAIARISKESEEHVQDSNKDPLTSNNERLKTLFFIGSIDDLTPEARNQIIECNDNDKIECSSINIDRQLDVEAFSESEKIKFLINYKA